MITYTISHEDYAMLCHLQFVTKYVKKILSYIAKSLSIANAMLITPLHTCIDNDMLLIL